MAVTHVHGALGYVDAVSECAAAGDHHLALGRSQALGRERIERQKAPEVALTDTEPLQR